jgi:hypothetical protein
MDNRQIFNDSLRKGSPFMASNKKSTATRRPRVQGLRNHGVRTQGRERTDAIALLKADHRQVEEWFSQFESASKSRKQQLADRICDALTVHTTIEEEIFYPSFLDATEDKDTHHEAVVEHAAAKKLIEEIRGMSAADDYFHAKVTVLSEMIKHHVKEEEQPGGMFAEARKSRMDLRALGQELLERKKQLQARSRAA